MKDQGGCFARRQNGGYDIIKTARGKKKEKANRLPKGVLKVLECFSGGRILRG